MKCKGFTRSRHCPVRGRDGNEIDLSCLEVGAPGGPLPGVARSLTFRREQLDPRPKVHPDGRLVLQARIAWTRSTERTLIPERTLAAGGGVCLTVGAARAARCRPAPAPAPWAAAAAADPGT